MCISTGNFDLIFFSRNYALFELRNLAKMKDTTETVCQRNSSKATQQNFVKLCSYEGLKDARAGWPCASVLRKLSFCL